MEWELYESLRVLSNFAFLKIREKEADQHLISKLAQTHQPNQRGPKKVIIIVLADPKLPESLQTIRLTVYPDYAPENKE